MSTFHLGVLISVVDGHLVADFADVHEFLEFMAGSPVITHALGRVVDESTPSLVAQFPFLADIKFPDGVLGEAPCRAWLLEQTALHGEWFEVEPLAPEDHTNIDPITELAMIAPHMQVIPIAVVEGT